jgi:hypothetical protein
MAWAHDGRIGASATISTNCRAVILALLVHTPSVKLPKTTKKSNLATASARPPVAAAMMTEAPRGFHLG